MKQNEIQHKNIVGVLNGDHLREVVDNYPGPFVMYDNRRRYLYVNRYMKELTGIPEEKFVGHTDEEIYAPYTVKDCIAALKKTIETRLPQKIETTMEVAGRQFDFVIHYIPLVNEREELKKILAFTHDITTTKKVETARQMYTKKIQTVLESVIDSYFFLDRQDRFVEMNKKAEEKIGKTLTELKGKEVWSAFPEAIKSNFYEQYQSLRRGSKPVHFEGQLGLIPGCFEMLMYCYAEGIAVYFQDITARKSVESSTKKVHDDLELKVAQRTMELFETNTQLQQEIFERREKEKNIRLSNELLKLLGKFSTRKEYIDAVVKFLHEYAECECVGIRVVNEARKIPYESYIGFSKQFWEAENWLSLQSDQCVCTRVVTGKTKPTDRGFVTAKGSFYCAQTSCFWAALKGEEGKEFRLGCANSGFESLAVIPIRYKNQVVGVIHLADRDENKISLNNVEFIESVAYVIGEGIYKFDMEDRIRQEYHIQTLINVFLHLSLKELALEEILTKVLEMLVSVPWFDLLPMASIHLIERSPDILVLKAQIGFPAELRETAVRIPLSWYGSPAALKKKEILYFDNLETERPTFEHFTQYSHYHVPILLRDEVMGILTLYVPKSYVRNERKEDFLKSIANVLAGIIQHKSTRKELRETNELLERIFSNTHYMIAYMDTKFNFIRVNDAYAQVDGHTADYYVGKNHFALYPNEDNEHIFHQVIRTGRTYNAYAKPFVYREHPERGITYWDWNLQAVKDVKEKIEGLVLTLIDVTKRKQAEDELFKAQKELIESKRLSDIGTLAATVAHELRNPLAVIRLAAYSIKRKSGGGLLEPHLKNIEKKILESDQIINNLLFYSRLKLPTYEKMSVYEMLEECVGTTAEKFRDWQVRVDKKYESVKDCIIEADPLQLREVFHNLLNNAFESLPEKTGSVEISACSNELKKEIEITFKDSGSGIDKADLRKIAEPFFTTKSKGTGLGLTVSYQIVNLHGGAIEVKSEKGKGTSFIITLPQSRENSQGRDLIF